MAIRICAAVLLLALGAPLRAELLKLSLLAKPRPPFTLRLDIFQGGGAGERDVTPAANSAAGASQAEKLQKSIAEEIQSSISYEGFIVKDDRKSALLNVSGEFFVAREGEVLLEKIKVLKISKDVVTVEYDNQPYDIRIKGD